nr:uncharacterized protein LOC113825623 [Penaeus vannamei]
MKYLAFVLLAAAVCASEVEKREAEPSVIPHSGYRTPLYPRYSYGPSFPTHYHKRSADAEPSTLYGVRAVIRTPVYGVYGHSVHTLHKRAADAEASRLYSHGSYSPFPVAYGGYLVTGFHKRSAEPECYGPDTSTRGLLSQKPEAVRLLGAVSLIWPPYVHAYSLSADTYYRGLLSLRRAIPPRTFS